MKNVLLTAAVVVAASLTYEAAAQKIKVTDGNLKVLAGQSSVNVVFTYDNMRVGKFEKESDYIADKKADLNKKEAGRGDEWAKKWADDRRYRFEPKFIELFEKYSQLSASPKAKYTLVINTNYTEPGFNVGVMRKNSEIGVDWALVETADRSKVAAKGTMTKAVGRTFFGGDFDTGMRIEEAYADGGKAFGDYVHDEIK